MGFKDDKNEEFGGGARQRKAEQARIAAEIKARDMADIAAVKSKPKGVDINAGGAYVYRDLTKMEKMAYDDAVKRQPSELNEDGMFRMKHRIKK